MKCLEIGTCETGFETMGELKKVVKKLVTFVDIES
jgi:hypothetical protein